MLFCFFFKQKTAYELRISDWSSDVCSSDLAWRGCRRSCRCSSPARGHRARLQRPRPRPAHRDRKSVVQGKSVSVRVDLGGRRIVKKKRTYTIKRALGKSKLTRPRTREHGTGRGM